MFVEKIDSMLGDVLSCLCGVVNRLVSKGLEMSSSWIFVMQALVDDLLPVSQMLFPSGTSSNDYRCFFFLFSFLLDLFLSLFRDVHKINLLFSGLSLCLPKLSFWNTFYVICWMLTYVKLCSLLVSYSGLTLALSNMY